MAHEHGPTAAASRAGGLALATLTRGVAAVRRAPKPLHPRGDLVAGELRRTGAAPATGVGWLDETAVDGVLVRRSRAIGWPSPLPDVHGLALRVPLPVGYADVLLATTGLGRVTRHLLAPGWGAARPLTTLLPYRSAVGPVLLAAVPVAEDRYDLGVAVRGGPWRRFGELSLRASQGSDPLVSFDPVRHPLPDLDTYPWVERLREPAYLTARRSRSGR